jgi:hypothetical protein
LAVAIHPPLPLLQPVGVPGQVVVDDGCQFFLQVDPFREAVGGHQHPWLVNGHFRNLGLPLLVAHAAGYAGYLSCGSQVLSKVVGKILRRGHIAAPENGVKALFEEPLH